MKKFYWLFFLFLAVFLFEGCVQKEKTPSITDKAPNISKEGDKKMAEILLIVADNYKEEEYTNTKKEIENAGFITETASSVQNPKSTVGKTIKRDVALPEVDVSKYKGIVFIGGPGTTAYFNDENALRVAQEAASGGKITAAICIAPIILANAGVLEGKKATVFDAGDRQTISQIEAKGAVFTDKAVVQDGKIITASGPAAAAEFGKTIVAALK